MRSMTGFGTGEAALGKGRVLVEVRSLNHRFLDTRIRLPSEIADHTFYVEQRCRQLLLRGRFDVTARLEGPALPPPDVDLERGRSAYDALCRLRDEVAPGQEVPLAVLASVPDLFSQESAQDLADLRSALDTAITHAVEDLNRMKQTEGRALGAELRGRLDTARQLRQAIASDSPRLAAAFRKRVQERLERLVRDHPLEVDPSRLVAEVALLAERGDLTEELIRLECHFAQFESVCDDDGASPIGRRLDFLLQEVGREANTIGAKCQDATLAHLVVDLKAEIERMREQVQNVE
jgi:uncharacterized protein (TIGR00255 family)